MAPRKKNTNPWKQSQPAIKQPISKEAAFIKAAKLLWTPEAIKQVEELAAELAGAPGQ